MSALIVNDPTSEKKFSLIAQAHLGNISINMHSNLLRIPEKFIMPTDLKEYNERDTVSFK